MSQLLGRRHEKNTLARQVPAVVQHHLSPKTSLFTFTNNKMCSRSRAA